MYDKRIKKYIFLGGIVTHMYKYVEKYNITNTIGYGNGYKLLYPNLNHVNLTGYPFPNYNKTNTTKNLLYKNFIHVGRFSVEKNQLFLIKSFHYFLQEINDFSYKLYIIGRNENSVKQEIKQYIIEHSLNNNIIVKDWMPQNKLLDFSIKEIDYNIITSANEGLSGICLEMMKIGIPTISSNISCINEIITDNDNGMLFDYKNYKQLLIYNKSNSKNLTKEINKHIDINITNFISVLKMNTYVKKKYSILITHDLHWWSFDTRRTILKRDPKSLIIKNEHYFNNIQLLKKLNLKALVSLYTNVEFDNIIKDSGILKNYINYYPCIKSFNKKTINKKYNIISYGSITEYIYPLRNKLYSFLKRDIIPNTFCIENNTVVHNCSTKGKDLNDILNSSWLCVATCSLFNYYLRKYNEIGNSSCVIIGNITNEIKYVIKIFYIYVNKECTENFFKYILKYYLNKAKSTVLFLFLK